MATPDVTVMGAGIFGLSCAWAMARRGARVLVIDPGGVGAGSSGGLVGALAPHVPENWNPKKAFQLESLLMAGAWWQEVENVAAISSGYARTGRMQPLADDDAVALARTRGAQAGTLWQGQAVWQVIADPADGWMPTSPTGLCLHDTLSARIAPRRALDALVRAISGLGGTVAQEGLARGPVLWATGTEGLAAVSEDLGKIVGTGVKGQAALFRHDVRSAPQLFLDTVHVVPHDDGTVAIGSTSERVYSSGNDTDYRLDALIERVRALVPALADAPVIDHWAGVRPRAATRSPMLGSWPGRAGHFIANGGFKIGFGIAPKVAETMADLILEGEDSIPAGFRVEDNL